MNPIRPGPFNRGPFQGVQAPFADDRTPALQNHATDSVAWLPKQRGQIDLTVNVAILALLATQAAIGTRGPLVVNRPWTAKNQIEQSVNRAIYAQPAAPRGYYPEPQAARRAATQIEHAPNIAVRFQTINPGNYDGSSDAPTRRTAAQAPDLHPNLAIATVAAADPTVPRDPLVVNRAWRAPTQAPDVAPNVAVRVTAAAAPQPPSAPADPQQYRRAAQAPEPLPNIAVQFQTINIGADFSSDAQTRRTVAQQPDIFPNLASAQTLQPLTLSVDQVTWRARFQNPELAPNVAVRVVVQGYVPPPALDAPAPRRAAAAPDLFPNVALRAPPPVTYSFPALGLQVFRRPFPQVDVLPNVALNANVAMFIVSADDALQVRRPVQVDLFPNLAALASGQVAQPFLRAYPDPATWVRRAPVPDLFPNLALVPPEPPGLVRPLIEPAVGLRLRPVPEVFPNLALGFQAAPRLPPAPLDPAPGRRQAPGVDLYPNVAVAFSFAPYVPPAPVEPPTGRRRAPGVDVPVNVAAQATPPAPLFRQTPIEPTYFLRHWPPVDFYKNVSVQFPADVSLDVRVRISVALPASLGIDRAALVDVDPSTVVLGVYS